MTPWRTLLLAWSAALGAACTEPPPASDGAVAADLATVPDQADCLDETGDRGRGGVCLYSVRGRVLDDNGVPVRDTTVTVCGPACFYGRTGSDGDFTVPVGQYLRTNLYSVLLHVQPQRAAYYVQLPRLEGGHATFSAPLKVLGMPADGPVIKEDTSAQTLTAGGVTLTVEAGTDIFISLEDAREPTLGRKFRPLRVTQLDAIPFLGDLKPAALYAFGPFEAEFSKPARLSLDNTQIGLPASTAVEFLGQQGLLKGMLPGSAFSLLGTGKVSADGKRVEMDAGAGVSLLTWIAVRKKVN
jgi:hypothetical protein